MLQKLKLGRQKYGLKRYLQRRFKTYVNRTFYNSDLNDLVSTFEKLGLRRGTKVCVHSSLSRLGYIDGGADTIIDALIKIVGPSGLVMMPAFSMGGNMQRHLEEAGEFDARCTPSRVGVIPETFRRRAGVLRSCHPTNSVAAIGDSAEALLKDHEKSVTPYGNETPYGRLANIDNSFVLMLDTHMHSFLHHIQERVNFPNLFLPGETQVYVTDMHGNRKLMTTRIMRPRIPYYVAVPSRSGGAPVWAILHDYALMFPSRRRAEVRKLGYDLADLAALSQRRESFEKNGVLRTAKLGRGEIGLVHVRPYLEALQPEFEDLLERYREYYDPEKIAALQLPYS